MKDKENIAFGAKYKLYNNLRILSQQFMSRQNESFSANNENNSINPTNERNKNCDSNYSCTATTINSCTKILPQSQIHIVSKVKVDLHIRETRIANNDTTVRKHFGVSTGETLTLNSKQKQKYDAKIMHECSTISSPQFQLEKTTIPYTKPFSQEVLANNKVAYSFTDEKNANNNHDYKEPKLYSPEMQPLPDKCVMISNNGIKSRKEQLAIERVYETEENKDDRGLGKRNDEVKNGAGPTSVLTILNKYKNFRDRNTSTNKPSYPNLSVNIKTASTLSNMKPKRQYKIKDMHKINIPLPFTLTATKSKRDDGSLKKILHKLRKTSKINHEMIDRLKVPLEETDDSNDDITEISPINLNDIDFQNHHEITQEMLNPKTLLESIQKPDVEIIPPPHEFCDNYSPNGSGSSGE
ncbi:uncharacterized protein LOC126966583 isoform X2 [Leptidea sinapis]|uniref:uncharacterized protein LOC126966583 isoform X2 n=1 Tax=Leptidea sinapis TaxID=189913 RepID=UPI0021C267FC|nr:uncharacterized protein LOC126966583 isoform X2 [Leptidea sinapis]